MKRMNKILSIFLSLIMVVGILPMAQAFAADIVGSGTCGDNLTWELDSNGKLTISGSGPMDDYYGWGIYDNSPWTYSYRDGHSIYELEIKDGVSTIGDSAFFGLSSLREVMIADSVTSIGREAFFCDNPSLNSIVFPTGLEVIKEYAFRKNHFESIVIPENVREIDPQAFGESSIDSIAVDPNNSTYHSAGNCIIETATKTLVKGCNNSVIPNDGTVTSIGECAFYWCENLINADLPSGLKSIGDLAFYACKKLASISIPTTVTEIGKEAFSGCRSIQSLKVPAGVTKLSYRAFSYCDSLNSISFYDTVELVESGAFLGDDNLRDVYFLHTESNYGSPEKWEQLTVEDKDTDNKYLYYGNIHLCSHLCHSSNNFFRFIYRIVLLFWRLFNTNKYCSCGDAHY